MSVGPDSLGSACPFCPCRAQLRRHGGAQAAKLDAAIAANLKELGYGE